MSSNTFQSSARNTASMHLIYIPFPSLGRDLKALVGFAMVLMIFFLQLGQSIFSGQFNNLTIEAEVNVSLIPDRYNDTIMEYFMSENITVIDKFANISGIDICSSTAIPIRDILIAFAAIEVSCSECGKIFSLYACINLYLCLHFAMQELQKVL